MDSGEELEARELETIRDVCVAHGLLNLQKHRVEVQDYHHHKQKLFKH